MATWRATPAILDEQGRGEFGQYGAWVFCPYPEQVRPGDRLLVTAQGGKRWTDNVTQVLTTGKRNGRSFALVATGSQDRYKVTSPMAWGGATSTMPDPPLSAPTGVTRRGRLSFSAGAIIRGLLGVGALFAFMEGYWIWGIVAAVLAGQAFGGSDEEDVEEEPPEIEEDSIEVRLLRAATIDQETGEASLTLAEAVRETGASTSAVKAALGAMVDDGIADIDNLPGTGAIVYRFPGVR